MISRMRLETLAAVFQTTQQAACRMTSGPQTLNVETLSQTSKLQIEQADIPF